MSRREGTAARSHTGKKPLSPEGQEARAHGTRIMALARASGLATTASLYDALNGHFQHRFKLDTFRAILNGRRPNRWREAALAAIDAIAAAKCELLSYEDDLGKQRMIKAQIAEEILQTGPAIPNDLPPYPWAKKLVELAKAGAPSWVAALPGNGAAHISALLKSNLSELKIVIQAIDLRGLDGGQTIADALSGRLPSGRSPASLVDLVRALAQDADGLILLVTGAGGHQLDHGSESLYQLIKEMHKFNNIAPPVTIVLVSPVHPRHLVRDIEIGSFPHFESVFSDPGDPDVFSLWAAEIAGDLTASELASLIEDSCNQSEAFMAAVQAFPGEGQLASSAAHRAAGEAILSDVGRCCARLLRGASDDPDCIRALQDVKILQRGTPPIPMVHAWGFRGKPS